jgi:hypothetical protein
VRVQCGCSAGAVRVQCGSAGARPPRAALGPGRGPSRRRIAASQLPGCCRCLVSAPSRLGLSPLAAPVSRPSSLASQLPAALPLSKPSPSSPHFVAAHVSPRSLGPSWFDVLAAGILTLGPAALIAAGPQVWLTPRPRPAPRSGPPQQLASLMRRSAGPPAPADRAPAAALTAMRPSRFASGAPPLLGLRLLPAGSRPMPLQHCALASPLRRCPIMWRTILTASVYGPPSALCSEQILHSWQPLLCPHCWSEPVCTSVGPPTAPPTPGGGWGRPLRSLQRGPGPRSHAHPPTTVHSGAVSAGRIVAKGGGRLIRNGLNFDMQSLGRLE